MEKMKKWLEPTKNKVIAGVIAVLLVSGIGYGVWSLTQNKIKKPTVVFKDDIVFEYGNTHILNVMTMDTYQGVQDGKIKIEAIQENDIQFTDYIDFEASDFDVVTYISPTEVNKVETVHIDTTNVGENFNALLIATKEGVQETFDFTYKIVDTQPPVIEGDDEVTLEHDETFDVTKYKASDPVDGEIAITVAEGSGEVVEDQTTMTLVATDKNGNETRKEVKVMIKEAPVEEKPVEEAPTGGNNNATANTGGSSSSNNGNSNTSTGSGGSSNNGGGSTSETLTPPSPEKPVEPNYLCPNGKDKNRPCTDWIDPYANMAFSHHATMNACKSAGEAILDEWWEIDGKDVVRYACQELGMNSASVGSFYRLELIHNGESGQWWLNSNKQWVQ